MEKKGDEILSGNLAFSEGCHFVKKSFLGICQCSALDAELEFFFPSVLQMGKMEFDDRDGKDQSVLANLAQKSDVEGKGATCVVAVDDAEKWSVGIGAQIGRDKVKIKVCGVVFEVDGAMGSACRCVHRMNLPLAFFGLGKRRSTAFEAHFDCFAIGYKLVFVADDPENPVGRPMDDRFFLRDGQTAFGVLFFQASVNGKRLDWEQDFFN